jgi:hypothetical protein
LQGKILEETNGDIPSQSVFNESEPIELLGVFHREGGEGQRVQLSQHFPSQVKTFPPVKIA